MLPSLNTHVGAEAIWATMYMYTNLALSAYILGSITLIVIKGDEAAGSFRESANAMKQYTRQHDIPQVCRPMPLARLGKCHCSRGHQGGGSMGTGDMLADTLPCD